MPNEILIKAADIIEERGWAQNSSYNDAGAVCASYAIEIAAGHADTLYPDSRICADARDCLTDYLKIGKGLVIFWNDDPSQTKEQVIKALRGAGESC